MPIYNTLSELIGHTPLLRLRNYAAATQLEAEILGKLEYFNPAGSIKDRVALAMIEAAEQSGELRAGSVIIEPTSGNTGIGLASVAAARGYRVILTMSEGMSAERRALLRLYGAEIVLTPAADGMPGAIAEAERLSADTPGSFMPRQFDNPVNPKTHSETTGPELWLDSGGNLDFLVAGVGTGGTLTGTGGYLKSLKPGLRAIAVEPESSPVLSGGEAGAHGLQGIGAGFVPGVMDMSLVDEVIRVTEQDAHTALRELARSEGLLVGISSGAALHAAAVLARRPENRGKTIAVIFPDTGERYLSALE